MSKFIREVELRYQDVVARVYQVGGSVRDILLGVEAKDRDFVVVGATVEMMLALNFEQVGKDFPVFLHPKTGEEYALARKELKSGHGYKGFKVSFGIEVTLLEDLLRRDLTINAMALDLATNEIIDPYKGALDLQNKILRPVSGAFSEDPLRLLRACRFSATLVGDFVFSDDLVLQCRRISSSGELLYLHKQRIVVEYYKALNSINYYKFFFNMQLVNASEVLHARVLVSRVIVNIVTDTWVDWQRMLLVLLLCQDAVMAWQDLSEWPWDKNFVKMINKSLVFKDVFLDPINAEPDVIRRLLQSFRALHSAVDLYSSVEVFSNLLFVGDDYRRFWEDILASFSGYTWKGRNFAEICKIQLSIIREIQKKH